VVTGYGLNRNMGHDTMITTNELDNFDMSMDMNTMYHIRLEIMYRRYLRYKQSVEKHSLKTSVDKKSWLLIMGLAETSNYVK